MGTTTTKVIPRGDLLACPKEISQRLAVHVHIPPDQRLQWCGRVTD